MKYRTQTLRHPTDAFNITATVSRSSTGEVYINIPAVNTSADEVESLRYVIDQAIELARQWEKEVTA